MKFLLLIGIFSLVLVANASATYERNMIYSVSNCLETVDEIEIITPFLVRYYQDFRSYSLDSFQIEQEKENLSLSIRTSMRYRLETIGNEINSSDPVRRSHGEFVLDDLRKHCKDIRATINAILIEEAPSSEIDLLDVDKFTSLEDL